MYVYNLTLSGNEPSRYTDIMFNWQERKDYFLALRRMNESFGKVNNLLYICHIYIYSMKKDLT